MYATKTIDDVLTDLRTSRDGLSLAELPERRRRYGLNELPAKKRSFLLLFLRQFKSILVLILVGALALSILLPLFENGGVLTLADFTDAIAIGAILLLNAFLGFFQEEKAEHAIAMLQAMSEPHVHVRRGGALLVIPSRKIFPGDILFLEEGERISADGRVIEARGARVDEASMTGESESQEKISTILSGRPALTDQKNMVFRGTTVTAGHLTVCVTATGAQTELGKVAGLVSEVVHPPTPLERSMAELGRWLGVFVMFFCGAVFIMGALRGLSFPEMLLASASLAVAAVPEGLPAIVTVSLAIGVQRMIARRALTRELAAIETLGAVTVICTDKTGTITENRMKVEELWEGEKGLTREKGKKGGVPELLAIAASCNNARSQEMGDPTEVGLLRAAEEAGIRRLPILTEDVPFSSEQKYMMTSHEVSSTGILPVQGDRERAGRPFSVQFLKGAPEVILSFCALTAEEHRTALLQSEAMAKKALRVLGFAWKDPSEKNAHFSGLIGLMDPPREGVKEAIALAKRAGIRTVMITGDHAITAEAVARKVGIEGQVLPGAELEWMNGQELGAAVRRYGIFARVSPHHKVKILAALQEQGEIVAMGGDGVNDAPALKKAHVGFAMGKRGTDVARETAAMVLTDDHFATVVAAIEEGRTIYDNIRKFVVFLLRANFGELTIVFGALLIGMPLPFLPIHILLINLLTDSFPAMALAMEKPEPHSMERPPRNSHEHILHHEIGFILLAGILATIATFYNFSYGLSLDGGIDLARTIVVTSIILLELTLVFTCRSKQPLSTIGFFSNRYLLSAVVFVFAAFLLLLYSPLNVVVHLVPLTLGQWMLPVLWSVGALMFFELLKMVPLRGFVRLRGSVAHSSRKFFFKEQ